MNWKRADNFLKIILYGRHGFYPYCILMYGFVLCDDKSSYLNYQLGYINESKSESNTNLLEFACKLK